MSKLTHELKEILAETRDVAIIVIMIVVVAWFMLNGMAEQQYENYVDRLNHLEYRVNSLDHNIPYMELK